MTPGDVALGSVIVTAESLVWGFTNRSWRVGLDDGRQVVVQQMRDQGAAARRVALMRELPARFAAAGVPRLPELLGFDDGVVVTAWLEGAVGSELVGTDASDALAASVAEVAVRLRKVDAEGLALPTVWASPATLAEASTARLASLDGVSTTGRQALSRVIDDLPGVLAGHRAVFAHGDLNPTNVLVGDGRVVALLDVEHARRAHPAFDACWWDWVIRFHHRGVWPAMRASFEAAGGLRGLDPAAVLTLQKIRVLELAALATPETRAMWLERLEATAAWR